MEKDSERGFEAFTKNIARLRKKKGMTKKEMAEALGICVRTLNKIENGYLSPNVCIKVILGVYHNLGYEPVTLFEGPLE